MSKVASLQKKIEEIELEIAKTQLNSMLYHFAFY